jgi:hypothetical protein
VGNSKIIIICPIHGEFQQNASSHLNGQGCLKCSRIKMSNRFKMSLTGFIIKAKRVHLDKYDYSEVAYKNSHIKIKIICPQHGGFFQTPDSHLRGAGCPKCSHISTSKKLADNKQIFIAKANKIHNEKYDYSLVVYENAHKKTDIVCPKHGIFHQEPDSHLHGNGCSICGRDRATEKQKCQLNEFICKANEIHNKKYDYSRVIYKNSHIKIKIICPQHGEFCQTPTSHLRGCGCPICAKIITIHKVAKNYDYFLKKATEVHKNKYDYSKAIYTSLSKKIEIICPKHGSFYQMPEKHIAGQGCSKCKESVGEKFIRKCLKELNIEFESQKKFENCKNKRCLPFDFFIPDFNTCIEYDGMQHFRPYIRVNSEKEFEALKKRDAIKTKFCKDKRIRLIRIPYYTKRKKIKSILNTLKRKIS